MIVVSPCPRPVLESRHAPQAHPPHRRSHADARAGGLSPPRLRQPARPAPSSGAQTAARYAGRSHHGLALSLCALRPHVPGLSAGGQPGPHLGAAARRGGDAVRAGPQLRRGQPRAGRPGPPLEQDGGLQRGAGGGDAGAGAAALGADLTSVKCAGQWLTVGVGVDAVHGLALTVDVLENGEAATLTAWIGEIAAEVGATVLVSDDADGFKAAAADTGAVRVPPMHAPRSEQSHGSMTPTRRRDWAIRQWYGSSSPPIANPSTGLRRRKPVQDRYEKRERRGEPRLLADNPLFLAHVRFCCGQATSIGRGRPACG